MLNVTVSLFYHLNGATSCRIIPSSPHSTHYHISNIDFLLPGLCNSKIMLASVRKTRLVLESFYVILFCILAIQTAPFTMDTDEDLFFAIIMWVWIKQEPIAQDKTKSVGIDLKFYLTARISQSISRTRQNILSNKLRAL